VEFGLLTKPELAYGDGGCTSNGSRGG